MRNDVDVAIRYGALADSRFVARTLAVVRPLLSASPAYLARHPEPQTPQELLQHNCLGVIRGGRPYDVWRFARGSEWTEVRIRGDRIADDASLARVWAVSGAGIMLKGPIEQREELAQGTLVRLLRDWETEPYPLHALLPSSRFVPNRVRLLVDFLASKFERLVSDLS
jgi:DNA-binding transcriptional LysR family regulator